MGVTVYVIGLGWVSRGWTRSAPGLAGMLLAPLARSRTCQKCLVRVDWVNANV
jgi:hypothetical protein